MDRIWLKSYPPSVPHEIDHHRYESVVQIFDEAFAKYRDRKAFVGFGKEVSYRELDELSKCVAAWLQSRGLQKGDRVAIMMPNILQNPVTIAAVLRAGYVVVNVNPLYTPRELEHQLKDSGARVIFILENFATTLQQVIARTKVEHVVLASMGDLLGFAKGTLVNFVVRHVKKMVPAFELSNTTRFNTVLAEGGRLPLEPAVLTHEDVAFLQYTGGTTGLAKGATLVHRNIVANVLQAEAWIQPALTNPKKGPPPEQLIWVCALPLYHIFALTACYLIGTRLGGLNILIPNPRDQAALIKEVRPYRFNLFPAVNTLFNALANNAEFAKLDFSQLRVSLGGGMAVQEAVAKKWLAVTGCPICEAYGLSETSPAATGNPTDTDAFSGTIGLPFPSTDVAILDDDGKPVPIGERGEIAIRGPQVMTGYWNQPGETAKVMTPDGFFKTGDIGIMDERGYTRIVDRKKDMILVSGFNVYPNEIEGVVANHPGVLEVAAVGVPDPNSGEAVKLFVVKKDESLTERDLMQYCAENLTGYKKPKYIEFRVELPKTNVGKILRRELRDEALKKAA
ncbi:MAG: long-chain-fatty-acid--CoA ligase [Lautropia sp.]|nr:MAG: long-chain-fatty-acid--CoA ligase [Pseudomonadota bacterium]MBC6960233.1 long-chain-fatty-acid--CoA ligase [Lautropia sp.]MCL4702652.1 long-chain-fatty-acid--CoA ligase [Burkholderiaceae bacterium]MDL1908032.1 long-chain-fatty-acid--CoA ligase [Betaproteobacteria bacterium PRO1]MEB2336144.1 long-chain-fatty-acid--CoA ligase [Burkholderiales bacterium]